MEDNYSMFLHREREMERLRSRYPVCECCGHHIEDDMLLESEGCCYHINCFLDRHVKPTEDYIA